jgi:hypothetical protein
MVYIKIGCHLDRARHFLSLTLECELVSAICAAAGGAHSAYLICSPKTNYHPTIPVGACIYCSSYTISEADTALFSAVFVRSQQNYSGKRNTS